jgi:hypothetical protein
VPTVKRSICALVVSLACAPVGSGADEPKTGARPPVSIEVLAGRELTLDPTAAPTQTTIAIPVRCTPPDQFEKLTYQTLSVVLNGRFRDPTAVRVARNEKERVPFLVLTIETARLVEPGAYAVRVQPLLPDPAALIPAVLDFTLNRPAAELSSATPLRVERIIYLPWCWDRLRPGSLVLTEKSNQSGVSAPGAPWLCELRFGDGRPAGRLKMTVPGVSAGGTALLSVEVDEAPRLGKSSGVLTVRAHQLRTPEGYTVPVEVTTRAAPVWLAILIAAGIGVGYYARTVLDNRHRLLVAKAAAEDVARALDDVIARVTDAPLLADLVAIRDALRAVLGARRSTPEEIEKAAQDAQRATEARLKVADDQRAELRARIRDLRAGFTQPDAQPGFLGAALRDALPVLDRAVDELNRGFIALVAQEVDAQSDRVANLLRGDGREWQARTAAALQRFGNWPEANLSDMTTGLTADLTALAPKLDELLPPLLLTLKIVAGLRHQLLTVGVDNLLAYGTDIASSLTAGSKTAEAELVRSACKRIETARTHASAADFRALADAVHDFQNVLGELIEGFARDAHTGVPADAAAGKYLSAIRTLVPQVPARSPTAGAPAPGAGFAAQLAPTVGVLSLEPTAVPTVGRPVEFRLRLVSASGQTVPTNARWFQDGRLVKEGADALTCTPDRVGELRVRAESLIDGAVRSAEVALPVRAAPMDAPTATERELKTTERIQFAIFGALITFTGFLLFQGGFIGTAEDLGVAFLWGFTTDIGVAKVRELATPLLSRAQTPARPAGSS